MELMLCTDQREIDARALGRQHMKRGKFEVRQGKAGEAAVPRGA